MAAAVTARTWWPSRPAKAPHDPRPRAPPARSRDLQVHRGGAHVMRPGLVIGARHRRPVHGAGAPDRAGLAPRPCRIPPRAACVRDRIHGRPDGGPVHGGGLSAPGTGRGDRRHADQHDSPLRQPAGDVAGGRGPRDRRRRPVRALRGRRRRCCRRDRRRRRAGLRVVDVARFRDRLAANRHSSLALARLRFPGTPAARTTAIAPVSGGQIVPSLTTPRRFIRHSIGARSIHNRSTRPAPKECTLLAQAEPGTAAAHGVSTP